MNQLAARLRKKIKWTEKKEVKKNFQCKKLIGKVISKLDALLFEKNIAQRNIEV